MDMEDSLGETKTWIGEQIQDKACGDDVSLYLARGALVTEVTKENDSGVTDGITKKPDELSTDFSVCIHGALFKFHSFCLGPCGAFLMNW